MKRILVISVCTLATAAALVAQAPDASERLRHARQKVSESRSELTAAEQRASRSVAQIRAAHVRAALIDSTIGALEAAERATSERMTVLQIQRDSLQQEIARLRQDCVVLTRLIFRQRLLAPASSALLLPEEHSRIALRQHLYARFNVRQKQQLARMQEYGLELDRQDSQLTRESLRHQEAIFQRRRRILALVDQARVDAATADSAGAASLALRRIVDQAERSAERIESEIQRMSQASQPVDALGTAAAEEGGPRKPAAGKEPQRRRDTSRSSAAADKAPAFRWPVAGRTILERYGKRTNPGTGTVTVNPGINISARKGTNVSAAAAGRVSLVSWLPSYGTLVIVEHDGGYRTVYANLALASVARGANVKTGARIGRVGESVGGEFLHFEVWRQQVRLDPLTVLP